MSTWNPISWLSGTALAQDKPSKPFSGRNLTIALIYGSIIFPAWFWLSQVTKHIPEPYLDEVYHVPQTQKYCDAQYHIWDPQITTPPGLYAFATLFVKIVGGGICNPYTLRLFNTFVLIMTMAYASACRDLITRLSVKAPSNYSKITKSWLNCHDYISYDTVHTAINIALFPLLFFFSGLFYTDILSTAVVLCMYMTFLRRPGAYEGSNVGGFRLYVIGLVALTMRQTNIFWVAIFMGGLEAVRTVKSLPTATSSSSSSSSSSSTDESSGKIPRNLEEFWAAIERYKRGDIHDVALNDADIPDFIFCILSIATAILYNPLIVLGRICPYITLLFSFGAFVSWNGGVVLGDKSNHIATIHLPQLLYLTVYTSFFSFPLLLPYLLSYIPSPLHVLIPRFLLLKPQQQSQPPNQNQTKPHTNLLLHLTATLLLTLTTLLIIHKNTLIHPFTLADNRHYVFYIFRYTILRHWTIKYLLAPAYLLSGWLSYKCLSGQKQRSTSTTQQQSNPSTKNTTSEIIKEKENPSTSASTSTSTSTSPKTSFLILYFLTTTLSLITAPLVEPRYFIIPWVLWRLHVPSLSSLSSSPSPPTSPSSATSTTPATISSNNKTTHDTRLWIETLWFLIINAVTGYVFLFRGFEWVQEPGRVQRFMW